MKIALGVFAVIFLASAANAQSMGGGLSGPHNFHTLAHQAPADMRQLDVNGNDQDFLPSRFVTFDAAIAAGKQEVKEESKTIAQAAAENRASARPQAKIRIVQGNNGNIMFAAK